MGRAVGHALAARPLFWARDVWALRRFPHVRTAHRSLTLHLERTRWEDPETEHAARQAGLPVDVTTFGELPFSAAIDMLRFAGVDSTARVLDLGAGSGSVLLAGRALGALARGVELSPSRVRAGAAAMALCGAELEVGDARTASIGQPTHVVLAWTCWSPELRSAVAARLADRGITVVAFTHAFAGATLLRQRRQLLPWGWVDLMTFGEGP
jgi:hypothetical protein